MNQTKRCTWAALVAGAMSLGLVSCASQEVKETGADSQAATTAQAAKEAAPPAVKMPRGKEFVNESPAFSMIYPRYVRKESLQVPSEVLRERD